MAMPVPAPDSPPKWRQLDDFKVQVMKRLEAIEERQQEAEAEALRREVAEQREGTADPDRVDPR